MIIYREKAYSKKGLGKAASYFKKHPILPLSAASLGVASANYALNTRKSEEDLELQKKQLRAMENLTDALTDTTSALEREERARKKQLSEEKKNSTSPKYREKKKNKK